MKRKTVRLSNRDIEILSMLSNGDTYKEICSYYGISAQALAVTCYYLRKRTGIQETRDQEECKAFFSQLDPQRVADALNPARPQIKLVTHCQLEVFRLLAKGRTYAQIAETLGTTSQSVQNLASRGAKRAGIIRAGWSRTRRIREWLARYHGTEPALPADPMEDPMF